MNGRRGVLSAGTWCVDLNKTIPAWPVEDTMTYIVEFDRQNGGSGSNMAIDLKRLDSSLPVEAMGVIGDDDDGRFSARPVRGVRDRQRRARHLAGRQHPVRRLLQFAR